MKTTFYIVWFLCVVQLSLYLFFPFGGPIRIALVIKSGLYGEDYINKLFENQKFIDYFLTFDNMIAAIYFGALTLCSILPLLSNMNPSVKYKMGITCFLISMAILWIPKLLGLIF